MFFSSFQNFGRLGSSAEKSSAFHNLAKRSTALFDASRINQADGTSVALWNEMFARYEGTQETEAAKPTLDIDGINGLPVVRFSTDDSLLLPDMGFSRTVDSTFIGVFRNADSAATNQQIFDYNNSNNDRIAITLYDGKIRFGVYNTSWARRSISVSAGVPYIVVCRLEAGTPSMWVNGVLATGNDQPFASGGASKRLGSQSSGAYFNGDIASFVLIKEAISTEKRLFWQNSLSQKFAIPLS